MRGFKNPDVVFVSRGQFQRDWQGMKLVGHGDQREGGHARQSYGFLCDGVVYFAIFKKAPTG